MGRYEGGKGFTADEMNSAIAKTGSECTHEYKEVSASESVSGDVDTSIYNGGKTKRKD